MLLYFPGEVATRWASSTERRTLSGHSEQVEAVIDKAGDFLDEKTEGKYAEQVDQGQQMAKEKLSDTTLDEPEQPA